MASVMPRTLIHGEGRLQLSLSKTKMMGGITMTHWDMYNTFERLTFILGCLALAVIAFIVLLTIIAVVLLAIDKIQRDIKESKERDKLAASEPIDGTYWVYDCKAEIKRLGHELRELTWENVRKSAE